MELNSKEQASSPQKQGVKVRSKSTEEIQPAKKVTVPAQLHLGKEPPMHVGPSLQLGEPFEFTFLPSEVVQDLAFHTPQKSLPNQMDGDECKGSCPVPAPNTTQQ